MFVFMLTLLSIFPQFYIQILKIPKEASNRKRFSKAQNMEIRAATFNMFKTDLLVNPRKQS